MLDFTQDVGCYAGIGSRSIQDYNAKYMNFVAEKLALLGWTLRSGGAEGSDTAFEAGVPEGCPKEIYLPWKNFNKNGSPLWGITAHGVDLACKYHPLGGKLRASGTLPLMVRNGYQVLGQDLQTPSKFIVCYTKDAMGNGGTGQAIRIAKDLRIPVYDIADPRTLDDILEALK